MRDRIFGFTFQSAHRALHGLTWFYADKLRARGYRVDVFDLGDTEQVRCVESEIGLGNVAFCFAPQGVGSRLGKNGQSLWRDANIPFVCLHGDHPCYNIFNHFNDTPLVGNLYQFESFAEANRRYLGAKQPVDILPFQTGDIGAQPIPFGDRPIRLLYLKRGESVEECVATLNNLPAPLRDGLWSQIQKLGMSPDLDMCALVLEVFSALGATPAQNFDLYWGCVHWVDTYMRRKRARDFVEWAKRQEGAVIIGDGWDNIDKTGARAIFRDKVDITEIGDLYRHSQIVGNVTPYGRDVIHERVAMGLLNESIVISDTNAWWEKEFGAVPALKRFEWAHPLEDQLAPLFALSMKDLSEHAGTGRAPAQSAFTKYDVCKKIIDFVGSIDPAAVPQPQGGAELQQAVRA